MSSQISNSERPKWTQHGVSRKRKVGDRLDGGTHLAHVATRAEPAVLTAPLSAQQQPLTKPAGAGGNKLLAGYLAHEFLTKGTLLGKRWDPAEAARPLARHQPEAREPIKWMASTALETEPRKSTMMAYVEVAHLLKTDVAHVPGVVNPTQLARWLHL